MDNGELLKGSGPTIPTQRNVAYCVMSDHQLLQCIVTEWVGHHLRILWVRRFRNAALVLCAAALGQTNVDGKPE